MKIILTDINILSHYKKRYKTNEYDLQILNYAERVCNSLFGEISLNYMEKLGINKFETVFIDSKAFSVICSKKRYKKYSVEKKNNYYHFMLIKNVLKGKPVYVCKLINEKGYYEFSFPELVCFELSESTSDNTKINIIRRRLDKANTKNKDRSPLKINYKKIQAYLVRINLKSLKNIIILAKRDFDFVERFNNEMFHQNISYNGRELTRDEVKSFYETDHFMKTVDLSNIRERIAFISLYGITFKGLELKDFYSIDGIFSLQPNRERDNLKQLSGCEVFKLILSRDINIIKQAVSKMGESLLKLPVPTLNLNDYNLLKQNYSLYCGIADIGCLFVRIMIPELEGEFETFHRTAARMVDYSLVEKYFNDILKWDNDFDVGKSRIYETLIKFETVVKDKKLTIDLNHNVKEFKL